MGTRCRIVVHAPSEDAAAAACADAFDRIAEIETVLSDYRPDSEASRLMRLEPGIWHAVSPDLACVLRLSGRVHAASDGAFDPAIGPLTQLWRQARREGRLPDPATLADARARSGWALIEVDPENDRVRFSRSGMGLDFGGIGKGYAADEALAVLRRAGLPRALVDFGGDLVAGDPPPGSTGWLVEIPDAAGQAREIRLANEAVASSGDAEQFIEIDGVRYAHILDPRTGLGLTRPAAATVRAPSCALADALASAACVMGAEGFERLRLDLHAFRACVDTPRPAGHDSER